MHPRNLHKNGYDFEALIETLPALKKHTKLSPLGRKTIDFANQDSVKVLNAALLKHHYNTGFWDIPKGYLCPPVPGRADYIHGLADLISNSISTDPICDAMCKGVMGLDIGTGANLIYPIVGQHLYDWQFVASDSDKVALRAATLIQQNNVSLQKRLKIRHQQDPEHIFKGVIGLTDQFTFTMCNPPFHASQRDAALGNQRKTRNLKKHQQKRSYNDTLHTTQFSLHNEGVLNFAGQHNELWCKGGELGFISRMINESVQFKHQVEWFTSLVSKKQNIAPITQALNTVNASEIKIISMNQGSKQSRFVAWRFC